MKIAFDEILCNLAGIPLNGGGKELTLKMVAINALMAEYPDERTPPGEKFARYALSRRIYKGNYEFRSEEIAKLKTLIEKNFEPIVVGAAFSVLSGETQFDVPETHADPVVAQVELEPAPVIEDHGVGVPA